MINLLRNRKPDYQYTRVDGESGSRTSTSTIRSKAWLAIVIIAITGMAFILGRLSKDISLNNNISNAPTPPKTSMSPPKPYPPAKPSKPQTAKEEVEEDEIVQLGVRNISHVFATEYDFYGEPTESRKNAWASLIPEHKGSFIHPYYAPTRSVFSVFHQLHCLEVIWESWWQIASALDHVEGRDGVNLSSTNDLPEMLAPKHVNHCIELLRVQLKCTPDLTIEVADRRGGVTGFGTEHQCVDWDGMVKWVVKWDEIMFRLTGS